VGAFAHRLARLVHSLVAGDPDDARAIELDAVHEKGHVHVSS
jgi:hypothetical protein